MTIFIAVTLLYVILIFIALWLVPDRKPPD